MAQDGKTRSLLIYPQILKRYPSAPLPPTPYLSYLPLPPHLPPQISTGGGITTNGGTPTHRSQTPVKKTNQNLQRRDAHAKCILPPKKPRILPQVGDYTKRECHNANSQADNSEILEMPAVGVIAGRENLSEILKYRGGVGGKYIHWAGIVYEAIYIYALI